MTKSDTIKKEGAVCLRPSSTNNRFTGESSTIFQRYNNYMPLDYIKAELIDIDKERILNHHALKFVLNNVDQNGEIFTPKTIDGRPKSVQAKAQYKNMIFRHYILSDKIELTGSLHTLSNGGFHNFNDFKQTAFRRVLFELYTLFGILPKNMRLFSVEWGVNLIPEIDTDLILNNCLFHKRKPFETVYEYQGGHYIQCKYTQYIVKLYNKGKQYQRGNVFRVEHKQTNFKVYADAKLPGRTLQDLINSEFAGLKTKLLELWNEVLFIDPSLPITERYTKLTHREHWKDLFKNRARKTVRKRMRKLKLINETQGEDIQNKIRKLISQKIDELNNNNISTWLRFSSLVIHPKRYPSIHPSVEVLKNTYPILFNHYFHIPSILKVS